VSFQTQEKTIDGIDVKVTPFKAAEAIKIQSMLAKILGPALGRAAGALGNVLGSASIGDLKVDGEGLAAAISELASKLSEEELLATLKRLLAGCLCVVSDAEGKRTVDFSNPMVFEDGLTLVFQGKTLSVYSVVAFVLRVNYPDFFAKVPRIGGLLGTILSSKKADSADASASSDSAASASSAPS
jgi:hypothetical protein